MTDCPGQMLFDFMDTCIKCGEAFLKDTGLFDVCRDCWDLDILNSYTGMTIDERAFL